MTLYIWTGESWQDISHASKREHVKWLHGAREVERKYGRCTALTKPNFPDECFDDTANCSCKTVFEAGISRIQRRPAGVAPHAVVSGMRPAEG